MIQELQYPFDANYIIAKKKKLRRMLLEQNDNYVDKKIAILGGYTTSNIKLIMELFLLDNGIRPEFYESEYNAYKYDVEYHAYDSVQHRYKRLPHREKCL